MRAWTVIAFVAVTACSQSDRDVGSDIAGTDERIACALTPDATFARTCRVERSAGPDGLLLTILRPDGGFRRLRVTDDGRGVVAADGAERAEVAIIDGNRIEVAIGNARYRLPATISAAR